MSELRAPDPTLTSFSWDVLLGYGPYPSAHRLDGEGCGEEYRALDLLILPSDNARWFAVPCRDCFPDAPPPGASIRCCGSPECWLGGWYRDPGLSWQVPS